MEQFWSCYSHITRADALPNLDLHMFKDGIKPMWEDAANKIGGKAMVRVHKSLAPRCWEAVVRVYFSWAFNVFVSTLRCWKIWGACKICTKSGEGAASRDDNNNFYYTNATEWRAINSEVQKHNLLFKFVQALSSTGRPPHTAIAFRPCIWYSRPSLSLTISYWRLLGNNLGLATK